MVAQHLKTHDADIIHDTQGFLIPLFAQLKPRRRRPVLLASTFAAHYAWPGVARRYPYHEPLFTRQMLRHLLQEWGEARLVDGFTVFAEGHRAPFARVMGMRLDRVHALPNCIDPDLVQPAAPDPVALGFAKGDFVLLFTGNVYRYKGCFELVEALARLAPRHPRLCLTVVGPIHPRERPRIEARLASAGLGSRVNLTGPLPREDVVRYIEGCHAFAFPSYLEDCPRSVIEAMAAAKPIIGTRIPGVEALDPEARFIQFAPVGDSEGLAAAIETVLDGGEADRQARGRAGRAHYLAQHTPEQAAVKWTDFYRSRANQG